MIPFSVLISTYINDDVFQFDQCLESIKSQTSKPNEVVIIKDGHLLPEQEEIISKYKTKLNIKSYLYEGKGQLGGALRFGILKCSNEVIARMDSDDICLKERFSRQLKLLLDGHRFVSSNIYEFSETIDYKKTIRKVPEFVKKGNIFWRNPVNHMTVMFYKKDVLDSGNYKELPGFEDWYLWLRMFKKGVDIYNCQTPLVYARRDQTFWSRRSGLNYLKKEFKALFIFYKEDLIPLRFILISIVLRIPSRLLPIFLTDSLFNFFFRKKNSSKD